MINLNDFIDELASRGVALSTDGEQLRIRARQGVLTPDLRERISKRKSELLALLRDRDTTAPAVAFPRIVADPAHRHEPFPLTDIQHAYWIGRGDLMELGNIAVHVYVEIEHDGLDVSGLNGALQALIRRHDMLRMVIDANGEQRVLASVPDYRIDVTEFQENEADAVNMHLEEVRELMSHQVLETGKWPLFDIRATRYGGKKARLHISLDILMADLWSLFRLFSEWRQLYDDVGATLPPLDISFRDYVLAEKSLEETPLYQACRSYWVNRIDQLPPAPELPLAKPPGSIKSPRFKRRSYELDKDAWGRIRKIAGGLGMTPSGLLLSAFAEVLAGWCKSPRFTLNLTLFNRLPMHPQVNSLIGDFTSTILLAIDNSASDSFEERARRIQKRLYADMEHRYFNGVRVLRELSQRRSGLPGAAMPVVFSSALGLGLVDDESVVATQLGGQLGNVVYTITQTPQVWIDHQVFENDGALRFNWDVLEELFPADLIDGMFRSYCDLLRSLADGSEVWGSNRVVALPVTQRELRERANDTAVAESHALLHELVNSQALRSPQAEAVVDGRRRMSYGELTTESARLAHRLRALGARPNALVAVVLDKGWEQIVAVLGILNSGAAYLPIDPDWPAARRNQVLAHGEADIVVTRTDLRDRIAWPEGITLVCVDDASPANLSGGPLPALQKPGDLAYVIYTSGSTGAPKGVAIEHQAVVNTVLDINRRFRVSHEDRVLAVSALGFDLSVYDIFGILSAGGKVVLPDSVEGKDAAHWCDLVDRENITLWNSVPALLQMLIDYLEGSGRGVDAAPRLILLSGDWVPLSLPERIRSLWKNPQVISLGGATEASIWSIYYPIDTISSEWHSVPYGKPLANQCFFVLNDRLDSCPDWVPGQLYIGGMGLARGYWRDDENTRQSFIAHPVTNERLYRTGDMGRYLPDGNIEFLGRADYQVKIKGYRIELGEIEATLRANPRVKDAVVSAVGEPHGDKRLVAYVVLNQTYRGFPVGGVGSGAGDDKEIASIRQFLADRLPIYMVPGTFMLLDRIPLTRNGKVDRKTLPEPTSVRGDVAASAMPRNGDEAKMAQLFASTLKLKSVGIHDSFFELGGDSLLATRLVANTGRTFGIELHLRDLFKGPSVAEFAARVAELKRSPVRQTARSGPDAAAQEEEGDL